MKTSTVYEDSLNDEDLDLSMPGSFFGFQYLHILLVGDMPAAHRC